MRKPYTVAAAVVAGAGILAVSTYVNKGVIDAFRLPKELVFRTEAILLLLVGAFAATAAAVRSWRDALRGISQPELLLCAGIAVWTGVTTLASTNRLLSEESIVTVLAGIIIYLGVRRIAPDLPLLALDLCLGGAAVNAILVMLQEYGVWNPFVFPPEAMGHLQSTALIGNPNDVGTFLAGPALAALAGAVALRGVRRWAYAAVAALLLAGMLASQTRTALLAYGAGVVVLALLRPWKQAVAVAAFLVVAAVIGVRAVPPVASSFAKLVHAAQQRQYEVLFSERLVPFITAVEMLRAHPLTGVGPGCFKFHYMDERLAVIAKYPRQWTRSWPQNFGETHNDHLQVAAETGLPGYALFLAALVVLAWRSRRGEATPERSVARALRIPLAALFGVIALAQFPLQIAAPRLMYLTLAALSVGWDGNAGVSPADRAASRRTPGPAARTPPDQPAGTPAVLRLAAIALCALGLYRHVYLPWRANHVLYDVNVRSEQAAAVGGSSTVIVARDNIDRLRTIAGPARCDADYYMIYAANARMIGDAPLAIEKYTAALQQADHRPEIYFQRGLTYAASGNLEAASADLAHAARFNPDILDGLSGELRRNVARRAGLRD